MALKTEKELTDNQRSNWLKALSAIELRNYGYAVTLLRSVVREVPGFLDGRKILRKSEIGQAKGKKGMFGGLSKPSLGGFKSGALVKKDPVAAIEAAEKILESDPGSTSGNRLLFEAATAAEMPETATFALETLADANPKDIKILHELARHHLASGDGENALATYNRIVEIQPNDTAAVKGAKDASAMASMSRGGWDEVSSSKGSKDYRDLIKNKDEAVSLEQKGRIVRSAEMLDQLLAELYEKYNEDNTNLELVKQIAALLEQKEDFQQALQFYDYAASLTNNSDDSLLKKASDLRVRILSHGIDEIKTQIEAAVDDPETLGAKQAELAGLTAQRAEMMTDECRKRVERNPSDLQLRYELGEQLFLAGHYQEAMQQLQRAKQSPNARTRASNLLGQCMLQKGMLDMAAKQFEEAARDLPNMDATKKDLTYNLGLVYEKMGDKARSTEYMKQIYEVDMAYRDVEQRVLESYGSGSAEA